MVAAAEERHAPSMNARYGSSCAPGRSNNHCRRWVQLSSAAKFSTPNPGGAAALTGIPARTGWSIGQQMPP